MSKPVLYSYWRSSSAWRVRIALAVKGIEYEYRAVHLVKGGQRDADFVALNPMKQVPALLIDGLTLTQSAAICEYLEETRPEIPLLPASPADRAAVRQVVNIVASGIQPLQNLVVLQRVEEAQGEAAKKEWARSFIAAGFDALEVLLRRTAGVCCVGDALTLADAFLVPQVYNARRWGVEMAPYPTIARLEAALAELPAFKAAHPSAQPDAE
eukprot:tig00000821_g4475.t1